MLRIESHVSDPRSQRMPSMETLENDAEPLEAIPS